MMPAECLAKRSCKRGLLRCRAHSRSPTKGSFPPGFTEEILFLFTCSVQSRLKRRGQTDEEGRERLQDTSVWLLPDSSAKLESKPPPPPAPW